MIKLGYSTGGKKLSISLKDRIKILLSLEADAIELSYIDARRMGEKLDDEDIGNLRQFRYKSIHAPVLISDENDPDKDTRLFFPDVDLEKIIEQLLAVAEAIEADTILFHPDSITDNSVMAKIFGKYLAIENMDARAARYNSVKDLQEVFSKMPQAKFVLDVNHAFTVDPTMKLAKDFYGAFKARLCHYHLSAFGGFHDSFYRSGEDVILKGITDLLVPIIHEGNALKEGVEGLKKEHQYILDQLIVN